MKNGKQIMTVVYIPFANPPVLIFCYHIKSMSISRHTFSSFLILRTTSGPLFYIFQHFPHRLFILIGIEQNHLVGKQSRILKKQRFSFQFGSKTYRRERFCQLLPGKSQVLFPVVITPYANNILVHFFN